MNKHLRVLSVLSTVVCALGIAMIGQGATPVRAEVKIVPRVILTAPYEADRLYPLRGDASSQKQKERERRKDIWTAAVKANPDLAKLPKRQRQLEQRKLEAADAQLSKIREDIRAAQQSTWKKQTYQVPIVTLNNGLVEVKIVPTLGMRVLNAIDLRTGRSLAGTADACFFENETFKDIIGWDAGYLETSFPYFEHGMGVRQSAGYRVVNHDDGSVTVAMNCRFTEHQHPRHMNRHGRYSQRSLSVWVTLAPGESCYRVTTRLDNPNPLRRADRCWTNHRLHADRYDAEHIIYPAGYYMPHGAGWAKPFWAEGGQRGWVGVSHFCLYPDYGFAGVYSAARDTNCLITFDPKISPGMKLYTRNGKGGFMEIWTGSGVVFEDPGSFLPPYVPVQYTMTYYAVSGIGRVDYANTDVAVAIDKGRFALVTPRPGKAVVTDAAGKVLAEGAVGPTVDPLCGAVAKRMKVQVDGKTVADFTWPRTYADTRPRLAQVKTLGGPFRAELEENTNHVGAPTIRNALQEANSVLKTPVTGTVSGAAADRLVSIANGCYRMGHFDLVTALCDRVGDRPETRYLRGLIAWEKGTPGKIDTDCGLDAYYMVALERVAEGKADAAVDVLKKLIAARPKVYRPRLLLAYLTKDKAMAQALAAENPASAEAQLVCEKLGMDAATGALKALLRDNPGATRQVKEFEKELTAGKWQHVRRYGPTLPNVKK